MIRSLALLVALLAAGPSAQAAPKPAKAPTAKAAPSAYDRCLAAPAARTSAGAIACVDQEIQRQDARVSRNYDLLLEDMAQYEKDRDPPERTFATDPVRATQRAWIAFRDADCRLPASPTWGARGALDARKCRLERATDRADELDLDVNPSREPPPGAVMVGPSPCEKKARTGRDMSVCAIYDLERADAWLNRVYKALLAQLGPGDKETARAAQRLWIVFRDADCGRMGDDRLWGRGAGYEATVCADALTGERAAQLQAFMKSHGLPAPR
jgi:uncharacterized protein YecT (DUF1311 family)